jgi:hypothetical protein
LKGDHIPRTDHVAIHCQPTDFEVSPSGQRGDLKPDAFRVDEDGISSNWLEFYNGSFAERLEEAAKMLARMRCVRRTHRCGVMNVGHIEDTGVATEKTVTVIHDPIDKPRANPGHALIKGAMPDDSGLLQALTLVVSFHVFSADAVAISKQIFGG